MEDKKTSILALLKILEEYSDEAHILTQPELLRLIEVKYNISIDRRTLYKNIEMLINFGYDISIYSENGQGYYLRERNFEPSQIFVLCNAIHSSNFIPRASSKELINKLLSTQSKYYKEDYKSRVFVENNNKKDNKEFFYNIEILSDAIKNKSVISFNYTKYDFNKKLINKRSEPYIISPYYLIYADEKTYLVGRSPNHEEMIHFRVDRMKSIKEIDGDYINPKKREDPYIYADSKLYMFNGEEYLVTIRCDNSILDNILDTFGTDTSIVQDGDEHFIAYVKSSLQGMKYLALQYLDHMEVIKPEEIRDAIKKSIKDGQKKYK